MPGRFSCMLVHARTYTQTHTHTRARAFNWRNRAWYNVKFHGDVMLAPRNPIRQADRHWRLLCNCRPHARTCTVVDAREMRAMPFGILYFVHSRWVGSGDRVGTVDSLRVKSSEYVWVIVKTFMRSNNMLTLWAAPAEKWTHAISV